MGATQSQMLPPNALEHLRDTLDQALTDRAPYIIGFRNFISDNLQEITREIWADMQARIGYLPEPNQDESGIASAVLLCTAIRLVYQPEEDSSEAQRLAQIVVDRQDNLFDVATLFLADILIKDHQLDTALTLIENTISTLPDGDGLNRMMDYHINLTRLALQATQNPSPSAFNPTEIQRIRTVPDNVRSKIVCYINPTAIPTATPTTPTFLLLRQQSANRAYSTHQRGPQPETGLRQRQRQRQEHHPRG